MSDFAPLPIDLDRLEHTAILASAGSGKTHQLVNRYVRLLAAGAPPSSVVASTFTRLAAGQIRDRVLRRLANAVDNAKARNELAADLGLKRLTPEEATRLLIRLSRQMHTVQIRTLDSFFASIVRCFAIELEVPADARTVDEHEAGELRLEAMRRMLDEQEPQRLVEMLRQLTQGDVNRSVLDAIDGVVTQLAAVAGDAPDAAWECVPEATGCLTPGLLEAAIDAISDLDVPEAKPQLFRAWATDRQRLHCREWKAVATQGIGSCVLQGKDKYGQSKLSPEVMDAYLPVARHARAELINRWRLQTIATRDLLRLFQQHHETVKRNAGTVTFDDLTKAMERARELGTASKIGFRLDSKLHHLLLDEFQDTSLGQWRALEPMVQELVSNAAPERTFFCVGDVKQSIYGWRNAAPQVLGQLPRQLPGVQVERLSRSYRSSPIIMDLMNTVFEGLLRNQALQGCDEPVREWLTGFDRHETEKRDRPGYVELRTLRRAEDEEDKGVIRFAAAADAVATLHRARPDLTIAVLTRSNKAVARMFFELGPGRHNISASGRGGGPLTDAPAVNAILDLLQLADYPDDTVAAFHLANSPFGPLIGLTDAHHAEARHAAARNIRAQLLESGYRAVISGWAAQVSARCDAREARRLLHLVDLAGLHDARATLRPSDFIRMVEATRVADIMPAAVQVMTIHQAKGLEFDCVILPELDTAFTANSRSLVAFEREDPLGPVTRICRHVSREVRALVPEMQSVFTAHEDRLIREQLSLLYVALSRAKHAMVALIDPSSERERTMPRSPAGVLRSALAINGEAPPATVLHSQGDPRWFDGIPATVNSAETSSPVPQVVLAAPLPVELAMAARGLTAASASAEEDHGRSFADDLAIGHSDARDRGKALHVLFEQVSWIDAFFADDPLLAATVRRVVPRRSVSWISDRVSDFRRAIAKPGIRAALSMPTPRDATVELHRELPFARMVNGRVQSGFIDRLVLHRDADGQLSHADLIDFKTDEIEPVEVQTRRAAYRSQLETYRAAVSEMFGLSADNVRMTLLFVVPDVNCRLE